MIEGWLTILTFVLTISVIVLRSRLETVEEEREDDRHELKILTEIVGSQEADIAELKLMLPMDDLQ